MKKVLRALEDRAIVVEEVESSMQKGMRCFQFVWRRECSMVLIASRPLIISYRGDPREPFIEKVFCSKCSLNHSLLYLV